MLVGNDPDAMIAIGNAQFAHNSKGLPTVPRAGIVRALCKTNRVFLVDENNTSQPCCNCNQRMKGLKIPGNLH